MVRCPSYSAEIPELSRFCLACGAPLGSACAAPTAVMPPPSTLVPSGSLDEGRFPAGIVLLERYRILGLLGQGGICEVYRAIDLKLSRPVALKFLPAATAKNQQLLARFHAEVRIARQLSQWSASTPLPAAPHRTLARRQSDGNRPQALCWTRSWARQGHAPSRPQTRQHYDRRPDRC
jgi:hypothetical protein